MSLDSVMFNAGIETDDGTWIHYPSVQYPNSVRIYAGITKLGECVISIKAFYCTYDYRTVPS